jgi:PEP-CTERM motif
MRPSQRTLVLALLAVASVARPASAAVLIISSSRQVSTGGNLGQAGDGQTKSTMATGDFSDSAAFSLGASPDQVVGGASQTSFVPGPGDTFSGQGAVAGLVQLERLDARLEALSNEFIRFGVDVPSSYTLVGLFNASPGASDSIASSGLDLDDLTNATSLESVFTSGGTATASSSGTLLPGHEYRLIVQGFLSGDDLITHPNSWTATADFDFSLQVSPSALPEPGTFGMVCIGLGAGAGGAIRRRKGARSRIR